jgi:hypothetical protein
MGHMFERYNEPARRALFFARREAGVLGSRAIETEHLLLGILKQREPILVRLIGSAGLSANDVRRRIQEGTGLPASRVPDSIEMPFSTDTKSVLKYTAEESERLLHRHIGTEHVLLGLLRLEQGLAWDILHEEGLVLDAVREALVIHVSTTSPPPPEIAGMIAALAPPGVQRSRPQSAAVYNMTALDGPRRGRRVTAEDGSGVFASFSTVDFGTPTQDGLDRGVHSIGPLSMSATTLPQLALVLEEFLGTPVLVLDHGDVNQRFDIELQGTYDNADSLIAALRDQLGLELTKTL